ncbi:undecaprenyl-diphosphate phosphatase [Brevibacillus humidisoli]|uniref:undecaprenyl-diphosphate phosphatase n=1 Tax=Brevibacillus humidisoli TaxID=2895522 RepID=UPI001E5A32B6|nr:undecaprenyl-diphosphate phosphatase [Brevibacillus humidisoli]UFJ42051.1 undecaprenyl-diphosphate phosphatase [Brevibacillus humidisoli]
MDSFAVVWKYVFLGLLQGFTEPIPISSSGHLVIAEHLLGLRVEGLGFEVLVNFASLLAVLLIYRADLVRLTVNSLAFLRTREARFRDDFRFVVYLVIATIPAAILGLLFKDVIADYLKGVQVIGFTLLITGLALWLIRNLRGRKNDADLGMKDALIVGFAQAFALVPGISRSGATIVAAMGRGMRQETALRFSFFLYIPVSLGGMILEGPDMIQDPALAELALPYAAAFLMSLVASYFSLKWFMGLMARGNLKIFTLYCLLVGLSVLLFL